MVGIGQILPNLYQPPPPHPLSLITYPQNVDESNFFLNFNYSLSRFSTSFIRFSQDNWCVKLSWCPPTHPRQWIYIKVLKKVHFNEESIFNWRKYTSLKKVHFTKESTLHWRKYTSLKKAHFPNKSVLTWRMYTSLKKEHFTEESSLHWIHWIKYTFCSCLPTRQE